MSLGCEQTSVDHYFPYLTWVSAKTVLATTKLAVENDKRTEVLVLWPSILAYIPSSLPFDLHPCHTRTTASVILTTHAIMNAPLIPRIGRVDRSLALRYLAIIFDTVCASVPVVSGLLEIIGLDASNKEVEVTTKLLEGSQSGSS